MNIKDFDKTTLYEWPEIFRRQNEINEQYAPDFAEVRDNFDISYYRDQEYFKHYCWCITEELTEAIEAVRLNENTHIREELIDALNFTIQLITLYGWSYEDVKDEPDPEKRASLDSAILETIFNIGMCANTLKNREWRESQYLVDLYVFEPRLRKIWASFREIFRQIGMDDRDIRELWDLKYQVNKFRIETKY